FQAEDGIRDFHVTGVQTCALPIWPASLKNTQTVAIDWTLALACRMSTAVALSGRVSVHPFFCSRIVSVRRLRSTCGHSSFRISRSEERRVGKECRLRWG